MPEDTISPTDAISVPEPVAASEPSAETVAPTSVDLPAEAPAPAETPAVPDPESAPIPAPIPTPSPTSPAPTSSEHRWGRYSHAEVVAKAVATRRSRVEKALDRIMAYVGKKGSISNDEVEKLDKVVDSTAALYLKQLVQRGLLRKVGTNRSTRYEKPE